MDYLFSTMKFPEIVWAIPLEVNTNFNNEKQKECWR